MVNKPTTASGYEPGQVVRVKATCLYLATKLGDLMPELVVVGGLVPSLLIDQDNLPTHAETRRSVDEEIASIEVHNPRK